MNKRLANFSSINEVLQKPLDGTQKQINDVLKKQENVCIKLNEMFKDREDDEGRQFANQAGIVDSLLKIYSTYDLNLINHSFTSAFVAITQPCSVNIREQLFRDNIYTTLFRLLKYKGQDKHVVIDALMSIFYILSALAIKSKQLETHPHFEMVNKQQGVLKLYKLFLESRDNESKDYSAFCIGLLYRSKEIDYSMREDIIEYVKSRISIPLYYAKDQVKLVLSCLARNQVNYAQIFKFNLADYQVEMIKITDRSDSSFDLSYQLYKQIYICDILSAILQDRYDEDLRQRIIDSGIIDSLRSMYTKRDPDLFSCSFTELLAKLVDYSSDNIKQQIVSKKLYPSLVRVIELTNEDVTEFAIQSISILLKYGNDVDPLAEFHPHFEQLRSCKGIIKIFELLYRYSNKIILRCAALSIGYLYKRREIENQIMKQKVVNILLINQKHSDERIKNESTKVLEILQLEPVILASSSSASLSGPLSNSKPNQIRSIEQI
ncbi:MAG: hypothetical protein EZS28_013058, partial [Streblomastix strix]